MTRIFNIIAGLCSYMIGACPDDSVFVNYSCISAKAKNSIQEEIYNNLSFLFEEQKTEKGNNKPELSVRQLTKTDTDELFYKNLEEYIATLRIRSDFFVMISLLQILDESLETILIEKIREYQSEDFSVVLNTNRETTGIGILPRTSCVWERKHRLSHSYNRLDNFLCNILLLENSILGELIDKHYFLKKNMFPDFERRKSIRIAASPLRLDRCFTEEKFEHDMVQYFRVSYPDSSFAEENESIWQKILKAGENQCDIIVFPEMLGNPGMTDYIRAKLKNEDHKSIPSLILLPSFWNNHHNTVTILDDNGNIICKQTKQNPYRLEYDGTGYLEGIKPNNVVNIFHYEGLGRIAVLICKDFLTTSYMEQLMRCFKLTLIIVPSFSTGSYDFRQSFDLCAHDDCNVVWINTCAALEKGKEANFENIGYVRKRIGRSDDDSQKLCRMPICKGAFSGRCSHDCLFFETLQGV